MPAPRQFAQSPPVYLPITITNYYFNRKIMASSDAARDAASDDGRYARYNESLNKFLKADTTTDRDKELILKSMDSRPPMGATRHALPMDEMQERIELIVQFLDGQQVVATDPRLGLGAMEVSVFMLWPLDKLWDLDWLRTQPPPFASVEELVRLYIFHSVFKYNYQWAKTKTVQFYKEANLLSHLWTRCLVIQLLSW